MNETRIATTGGIVLAQRRNGVGQFFKLYAIDDYRDIRRQYKSQ